MDQFVVRVKLLSQLQHCWTKGYCVVLQLESGVALEELVDDTWDDDIDMKPDLESVSPETFIVIPSINENRSPNQGGHGDNNDGSNCEYETDDYEYVASDDKGDDENVDVDHVPARGKRKRRAPQKSILPRKNVARLSAYRARAHISRHKPFTSQEIKLGTIRY